MELEYVEQELMMESFFYAESHVLLPEQPKDKHHLQGRELLGTPCPSCQSPLVKRVNGKTLDWFVACDKSAGIRCKYTLGWFESDKERRERIVAKYG